jgi:putative Ca2+/H+ antiporter (TMEM165/GDT1 family)
MKRWKTVLVILGIAIVVLICFYDQIVGQEIKFGPKSVAGVVVGIIILVIGLTLKTPKKEEKKEEKK